MNISTQDSSHKQLVTKLYSHSNIAFHLNKTKHHQLATLKKYNTLSLFQF
jgi:hypothetical protein